MLSYRIIGTGRPLLLVHGFGMTFPIWEALTPHLAAAAQLILVELPGLGASPAPAPSQSYYSACAQPLRELRQHLGLDSWDVVGYSSGSRAVEAYLPTDTAHIGRVIMLCPAYIRGWQALNFRWLLAADRRWAAFGNWGLTGWRLRLLIQVLGFCGQNDPNIAIWHEQIASQPLALIKSTLHALQPAGTTPFQLPPIPVRYLWGTRDWVVQPPAQPGPHDRLLDADHSAPVRSAAAVAEAIRSFLNEP